MTSTTCPVEDDREAAEPADVEQSSSSAAEPPAQPAGCPRCGSCEPWGCGSWCPECGYYPAFDGPLPDRLSPPTAEADQPQSLSLAIPSWLWMLGGGLAVIAAMTLAATVTLPSGGPYRTLWTLTQCGIGLAVFSVAHLAAYLFAAAGTDRLGPGDLFMKPFELWKPTFVKLPNGSSRVCLAAWGLFAAVCGLVFVGGVNYSAVFDDWGVQARAKPNVMQAVLAQVREAESEADSLEEAIHGFVGEAEAEEMENLVRTDCLIFGYTRGDEGFVTLQLATVVGGKLQYVGSLSAEGVPPQVRDELNRRLPGLEREKPFVRSPTPAIWLRPVLMLRVAHRDWTPQQQLAAPRFESVLSDVAI